MANILLAYAWSPYTTAAYFAKAFRTLGHDVRSIGPVNQAATARVPERQRCRLGPGHWAGDFAGWSPDVAIWIDAGAGSAISLFGLPCPSIGYFIDSHSRLAEHIGLAGSFAHRFCAQRQHCDALGAEWLPVACDPDVHTPTRTEPPEYDVAFVGNVYEDSPLYAKRREVVGELQRRYRCNFQSGVYFENMANVYASARVAFNISVAGDLNMRVFEATCAGRPLVTDDADGLAELLPGDWGRYDRDNAKGAIERIDYLLQYPSMALLIQRTHTEKVLAHHTYIHRAMQMLQAVGL